MRRIAATMALVAALILPAVAQTRDQAKAIVKQAVDFAKKNPKDRFLEEVSGIKGQFHFNKGQNNDLYSEAWRRPSDSCHASQSCGGPTS
jgi:hypothetical protein